MDILYFLLLLSCIKNTKCASAFCFSCLNIIIVIQLGYTYVNDGDGNLLQRMMTMKNLLQRARKTIKIKNMLFSQLPELSMRLELQYFLTP